jgi:hypothetical protein
MKAAGQRSATKLVQCHCKGGQSAGANTQRAFVQYVPGSGLVLSCSWSGITGNDLNSLLESQYTSALLSIA